MGLFDMGRPIAAPTTTQMPPLKYLPQHHQALDIFSSRERRVFSGSGLSLCELPPASSFSFRILSLPPHIPSTIVINHNTDDIALIHFDPSIYQSIARRVSVCVRGREAIISPSLKTNHCHTSPSTYPTHLSIPLIARPHPPWRALQRPHTCPHSFYCSSCCCYTRCHHRQVPLPRSRRALTRSTATTPSFAPSTPIASTPT